MNVYVRWGINSRGVVRWWRVLDGSDGHSTSVRRVKAISEKNSSRSDIFLKFPMNTKGGFVNF